MEYLGLHWMDLRTQRESCDIQKGWQVPGYVSKSRYKLQSFIDFSEFSNLPCNDFSYLTIAFQLSCIHLEDTVLSPSPLPFLFLSLPPSSPSSLICKYTAHGCTHTLLEFWVHCLRNKACKFTKFTNKN